MNPHWDAFAAELLWFVRDRREVKVGDLKGPGYWKASPSVFVKFPIYKCRMKRNEQIWDTIYRV